MQDDAVVLGLEGGAVLLLVEVGVGLISLHELALLVALALGHLEVELVVVLEMRLLLEFVEHVPLEVVVLRPLLVILLLLEQTQVLPGLGLCSLAVLTLGDAVLEC
jgi:hypothetical protein